jgi:hypothetical protein
MKRIHSSEMFNTYEIIRCHNPEDNNIIFTAVKTQVPNPVMFDKEIKKK